MRLPYWTGLSKELQSKLLPQHSLYFLAKGPSIPSTANATTNHTIEETYRSKGLDKDKVDIVTFRQECRKFADKWINIQKEEFKRLGITGNWENPYLTMDFHAEKVIAEEFQKFLMNGTLYQGSKPVMWSSVEKTALAEAEIEYHDHKSHTIRY